MKNSFGNKTMVFGTVLAILATAVISAPKNVLHYTKTGYFVHTYGVLGCTTALDNLAAQYHFTVKHSNNPNDLLNLRFYDLVVYDNNSDAGAVNNTVITAPQQALMDYMNNGGKYLGIHGAIDHRDQWTWYDSALYSGAKLESHLDGGFDVFTDTSTETKKDLALGRMWDYCKDSLNMAKDIVHYSSEISYFDSDVRGKPNVVVFQELRGETAKNKVRQSFSWIKSMPNGGKMMYSALGHSTGEWTENNAWLTKATWAYMKYLVGDFNQPVAIHKPKISTTGSFVEINTAKSHNFLIRDVGGKWIASGKASAQSEFKLNEGLYFVTVHSAGSVLTKCIFIH